ncbi:pyridoxamine 5'-phosphate oxidase family protein [Aquihabitans daechungensis]|uniref:pyridoxamine 5'-phosphate oxidase family protein n=1 Tax=Aquihabitans daechungensis TaxID=1052257 RepID=UPI003B9EEF62
MALVDRRTGIEVIEERECLRLLEGEVVGRLGVLDGGTPLILPINYAMDGRHVVFRTAAGTKADAKNRSACFEIDGSDGDRRIGWSVVIRGRLEEVTTFQAGLFDRLAHLPQPWARGEKPHVMRLVPTSIHGRRVTGNEAPPSH